THLIFFFQAEDGIRDRTVTGVQTCALPIFPSGQRPSSPENDAPIFGVFPIPGAPPCPGVVAHIVREQVMTADAKSKMAANLLRLGFMDVFLLVLGFRVYICAALLLAAA